MLFAVAQRVLCLYWMYKYTCCLLYLNGRNMKLLFGPLVLIASYVALFALVVFGGVFGALVYVKMIFGERNLVGPAKCFTCSDLYHYLGERNLVGPAKCFTCADLYQYMEKLLKTVTQHDKSSHYAWLKSRNLQQLHDPSIKQRLDDLKPLINKMTSESSAAIAVKLDKLTEEQDFDAFALFTLIKKLLLEQDNATLIARGVKEKNRKNVNKVHPELVGRQATVCFIVDNEFL